MFDPANWLNPETLMLNLTNAVLGLAVLALFGCILYQTIHALTGQAKPRSRH